MKRNELSACVWTAKLDISTSTCRRQKERNDIKIKDKSYTVEQIIILLATCNKVISKNAYLAKKWGNCVEFWGSHGASYAAKRDEFIGYRKKIRDYLSKEIPMKKIIQMEKVCTETATQKAVKEFVNML